MDNGEHMKCPYTVNMLVVEQVQNEYDTCGTNLGYQQITKTTREYIDCLQAECGAFYDGRCNYKKD